MCAGTEARERFESRMVRIAPGARLARRSREWTVMQRTNRETGVELTLRHGRRSICVYVPVCHSGPDLSKSGLRSVALPPSQRRLI